MDQTTINRRYRIERPIGEGGMAEVFLGRDQLLNRPVAIKTLRPQYARDPNFRIRFEREAQAVAAFTHPNIIDIYDVGEEHGTPYIIMEYVPGQNLKEIIEAEGPFDPDDVAALIEQVAAALDYAHERGVVHRDIKPQNIIVDADGLARVVDFGIAKSLADADLTEVGAGLGTVHYVSPEQASGLMATPSSDVYSLAVVAYEMLTDRLPFDGETPVAIALQHVHDEPRHPSTVNPEVPRPVGDIVMRALAKDPTRRFVAAGEFARALSQWRGWVDRQPALPSPTDSTTVLPRVEPAPALRPDATMALPRSPAPIPTGPHSPGLAPPLPATATAAPAGNQLGCVTWLIGLGVLALLGGLIWFGYQLAPGLSGSDGDRPEATATPTEETIATRPPPVAEVFVPNLVGSTVEEAADALAEQGLTLVEEGTRESEQVGAGRILTQDPPRDAPVRAGSAVRVIVSAGSDTVDIAAMDLFGLSADRAQELLEARGLVVVREDVPSTEVGAGDTVGTDPPDVARVGQTVRLLVSVGDRVQIPVSLQGRYLDEAVRDLERAGLVVAEQIGVPRATIESFGIDLAAAAIEDGDVVGVQDIDGDDQNQANFGAWLPRGTAIAVVYYDQSLDPSPTSGG